MWCEVCSFYCVFSDCGYTTLCTSTVCDPPSFPRVSHPSTLYPQAKTFTGFLEEVPRKDPLMTVLGPADDQSERENSSVVRFIFPLDKRMRRRVAAGTATQRGSSDSICISDETGIHKEMSIHAPFFLFSFIVQKLSYCLFVSLCFLLFLGPFLSSLCPLSVVNETREYLASDGHEVVFPLGLSDSKKKEGKKANK